MCSSSTYFFSVSTCQDKYKIISKKSNTVCQHISQNFKNTIASILIASTNARFGVISNEMACFAFFSLNEDRSAKPDFILLLLRQKRQLFLEKNRF